MQLQGSWSSSFSICSCKNHISLWAFWYASIRSVFELFDVHCKPSCCILAINFLQRNLHNKNCKTKHWYAKKRVDGFTKNRKLTTLMCVLSRNSFTGAFALSSWASLLWSSAFVVVNRQKVQHLSYQLPLLLSTEKGTSAVVERLWCLEKLLVWSSNSSVFHLWSAKR